MRVVSDADLRDDQSGIGSYLGPYIRDALTIDDPFADDPAWCCSLADHVEALPLNDPRLLDVEALLEPLVRRAQA